MKKIIFTLIALTAAFSLSGEGVQMSNQYQPSKPGNYRMTTSSPDNYWAGSIEGLDNPNLTEKSPKENPTTNKQQTLSIIKPDAVKNHHIGDIVAKFEKADLKIAAMRMIKLSKEQAGKFYQVHNSKPFYADLVEFMSSGPVVIMVLEGPDAIKKNREIMGATDPSKAQTGTIRHEFAESVTRNAVHGSDSPETAKEEIAFFFKPNEIY